MKRRLTHVEIAATQLVLQLEDPPQVECRTGDIIDHSIAAGTHRVGNINCDFFVKFCRIDDFIRTHPKARATSIAWTLLPNMLGADLFVTYFPGFNQCASIAMQGGQTWPRRAYDPYFRMIANQVDADEHCTMMVKQIGARGRGLRDCFELWQIVVVEQLLVFSGIRHLSTMIGANLDREMVTESPIATGVLKLCHSDNGELRSLNGTIRLT